MPVWDVDLEDDDQVWSEGAEPLSLDVAKRHLRIEDIEDDDEFVQDQLIPAVRERAEGSTGRRFITRTFDLKLDAFPACGWIEVPRPPLVSVPEISYVDQNGATQVWGASNYRVSAPTGARCAPGRIEPAYGATWPATRDVIDAVTVRFIAGYGTGAQHVPALLRSAMLMDIARLYKFREDLLSGTIVAQMPHSAKAIYWSFRSHPTGR